MDRSTGIAYPGSVSKTNVTIVVQDEDDLPPMFSTNYTEVSLFEDVGKFIYSTACGKSNCYSARFAQDIVAREPLCLV